VSEIHGAAEPVEHFPRGYPPEMDSPDLVHDQAIPNFESEGLVIGRLGPDSHAFEHEAHKRYPELSVAAKGPNLAILSNRQLKSWRTRTSNGWYWNPIDRAVSPRSWRESQRSAMSAGVVVGPEGTAVHNDLLGMQPLHYLVSEGALIFTNWPPALTKFISSMSVDPRGWASILLLGFITPPYSQFREIKSLPAGSMVRLTADGWSVISSDLDFEAVDADFTSIVTELERGLPGRWRSGTYTLSGGWDSRLLLGIAASQRSRRLEAWTTSPDDGLDLDIEYARAVVATLGASHREVIPEADSWPDSARRVLARLHHSTWQHAWLESLASSLRSRKRRVVDGIAGDVLFKGLFQVPEDDSAGGSVDARRRLWQRLGGKAADDADAWSKAARSLFDEVGFDDFDGAIRRVGDDKTWQTKAVLTTRTARGIALSPLRLFGPEAEVFLPFVRLPILKMALGYAVHPHRGNAFYKNLLSSVSPALASLPSTNDATQSRQLTYPRRSRHPRAIAELASLISTDESAMGLLGPRLQSAISDRDTSELEAAMRYTRPLRALQAAYCYASWKNANPQVAGGLFDE
jgi:Asparagine synthase